ncbi:MAG: hypothetical protein KDC33_10535 [Thermoleophilia bacterium]|nr:hypothetical protein [Thermoleophilia bacterium]
MTGDPWRDEHDGGGDAAAEAALEREAAVADGVAAFLALVDVPAGDRALAVASATCVLQAVADARGPDDPIPGMATVPVLIEDAVARARLADAAPGAREALGELEVALVGTPADARAGAAARLRDAIRHADARLGG